VVREPHRGAMTRNIYKILDEGIVFMSDLAGCAALCNSHAICPRWRHHLFHGSRQAVCYAEPQAEIPSVSRFTLTDGFGAGRSVFNHSMNYRCSRASKATLVDQPSEKLEALRAFTEKILPGAGKTRTAQ